jgi:radical SAM superfamily enzyme YgiQ (UPF0313 family)
LRIAFVSPNREQMPDPVLPLGVLYMMGVVGDQHEKTLIDLCFEERPFDHLGAQLDAFAPDLVAVGMRNIQNADYTDTQSTLEHYRRVMATIRGHTDAPVVMGGGGFSIVPDELMKDYGLDYGIVGEGELPFAQLVTRLGSGTRDVSGIPNLLINDGKPAPPTPARRNFMNLKGNVRPERQWADPRYYTLSGTTSLQTKRGCAMHCEYCTYPQIEGHWIRQRLGEDVADEWDAMIAADAAIQHVFIVDSVFNLPPSHAHDVCQALADHGNRTPWTCYVNPIRFDGELVEAMARAACEGVEIGSDSGTDAGLESLRKGFTTEHIRRASATCRQAGIKDCHTFMLGARGETLDDVERSLDFIEELKPFSAIVMAYKDDREAVDGELAVRGEAFRAQVLEVVARRIAHNPKWAVPSLGVRFNARLFGTLRRSGLRGPLWQHSV